MQHEIMRNVRQTLSKNHTGLKMEADALVTILATNVFVILRSTHQRLEAFYRAKTIGILCL